MNYKKYLIWAPSFRRHNAGVVVLHKLCHLLNNKGFIAYVTGKQNPDWNERCADSGKIKELISEEAIVVYPEVVPGNPLHAKYVVRYILNKPGLIGGRKTYNKHEILFCYVPILEKYVHKSEGVLEIPLIEPELFNNDSNYVRSGTVFYVGKGKWTPRIRETESLFEITAKNPAKREELAELFKKSELFYSYDNFTALIEEARLCGCPVVLIPDAKYSRDEILSAGTDIGLSYGPGDIERAKQTVHKYADVYNKRVNENFKLDNFIKVTQELCNPAHAYPEIDLAMGYLFRHYYGTEELAEKEVTDKKKYLAKNLHLVFLDPQRVYSILAIIFFKAYSMIFKRRFRSFLETEIKRSENSRNIGNRNVYNNIMKRVRHFIEKSMP